MQKEKDITKIEYELIEMNAGDAFLLLHANGQACVCPFQPVVHIQGPHGQMQASRTGCNTGCPHARLKGWKEPREESENPDDPNEGFTVKYIYSITCGSYQADRDVKIRRASALTAVPSIVRP